MKTKRFLLLLIPFLFVLLGGLFWPTIKIALIQWQLQHYCQICFGHQLEYSQIQPNNNGYYVIRKPSLPLGDGTIHLQAKQAKISFPTTQYLFWLSPKILLEIEGGALFFADTSIPPHLLDISIAQQGRHAVVEIQAERVPLPELIPLLYAFSPEIRTWSFQEGTANGHLALHFNRAKLSAVQGSLDLHEATAFHDQLAFHLKDLHLHFPPISEVGNSTSSVSADIFLRHGDVALSLADGSYQELSHVQGDLFLQNGVFQKNSVVTFSCSGSEGNLELSGTLGEESISLQLDGNAALLGSFISKMIPNRMNHFPFFEDRQVTVVGQLDRKDNNWKVKGSVKDKEGDELFFGFDLLEHRRLNGWFRSTELPVEKYAALLPSLNRQMHVSGLISANGNFDESEAHIFFQTTGFEIENPFFKIEVKKLAADSSQHASYHFDFIKGNHWGTIPIEEAIYTEKNSGLIFRDIKAEVNVRPGKLLAKSVEAFSEGIFFAGEIDLDYRRVDEGFVDLDVVNHTMCGKVSDARQLLLHLHPQLFMLKLPINGNVEYAQEGAYAHFSFSPQGCETQAFIQGNLSEGSYVSQNGAVSLHDLCLQFTYDHQAHLLDLQDIQGTLVFGTEDPDEYTLSSDGVHFLDLFQNKGDFDFWVGDRNRDIVRIVGNMQGVNGDIVEIHFDLNRTHFGPVHPNSAELFLKDWTHIVSFHSNWSLPLETVLPDLQKLSRTGLFSLSSTVLKEFYGVKKASGILQVDLDYQGQENRLFFDLEGHSLAFNKLKIDTFLLSGRIQRTNWSIDQLKWDNLSLSMDLHQELDALKIDFFGLQYGEIFLTGIDGLFDPKKNRLEVNLNLVDLKLDSLHSFPSLKEFISRYDPKGSLKASGKLFVDLFKGSSGIRTEAVLQTSLSNCSFNGLRFEEIYSGELELLFHGENTAFRFALDDGVYQFLGKKHQVKNFVAEVHQSEGHVQTQYFMQPDWLQVSLRLPSERHPVGEMLVMNPSSKNAPLHALWSYSDGSNIAIQRIDGNFLGCDIHLQNSLDHKLAGTVSGDFTQIMRLLNKEELQVPLHVTSPCLLSGNWFYDKEWKNFLSFNGKIEIPDFKWEGVSFGKLAGELQMTPEQILLQNLSLEEPAGKWQADLLQIKKENDEWTLSIPSITAHNIYPLLIGQERDLQTRSLVVRDLELQDLEGKLDDVFTLTGKGQLQFLNPLRQDIPSSLFAMPDDLLKPVGFDQSSLHPISGTIGYEIKEGKIYLTKFKDVYSDHKLIKYHLQKTDPSYIDFAGNLSIQVRIQPYHVLSKLAQLCTLQIHGTLAKPDYTFLKPEPKKIVSK